MRVCAVEAHGVPFSTVSFTCTYSWPFGIGCLPRWQRRSSKSWAVFRVAVGHQLRDATSGHRGSCRFGFSPAGWPDWSRIALAGVRMMILMMFSGRPRSAPAMAPCGGDRGVSCRRPASLSERHHVTTSPRITVVSPLTTWTSFQKIVTTTDSHSDSFFHTWP